MPLDASIYNALGVQPKSQADYADEYDRRDIRKLQLVGAQRQNELAALTSQQQIAANNQAMQRQNALQTLYSDPNIKTPIDRENAMLAHPLLMDAGQAAQKARLDAGKVQAETGKISAETAGLTQEQQLKLHNQHLQALSAVQSPDQMQQWLSDGVKNGTLTFAKAAQMGMQLQQDPSQLQGAIQRLQQMGMGLQQQLEMRKPTYDYKNAGGSLVPVQTNAYAGAVGPSAGIASIPVTVDANTVYQGGISRANNKDTQVGENLRAGVMPGGGLDDNTERTAQAIAAGQLPAPTGMALLNPKNQRVLGRVMEINPQYDSSTVDAKRTAARSFASGPLGNALRSVSTANAHLDQLGELADALNNGNMQIVNKVGNWYKAQTGNPAPTNFDAIKNIVGQEVVKAIVAGGGGVGEREEAAKTFSAKMSPQQLKEVMQHYRMVMGAQADNLIAQRDAAGLPRSTLPNYNGGAAASSNTVTTPDGVAHTFPSPEAAAKFKAAAGIK